MADVKISALPAASLVDANAIVPLVSNPGSAAAVTQKATVTQLVQAVEPKAHTHTLAQLGLSNLSNLAPADYPVSTATANALALKADKTELTQKADLTLLAQKADKTELAQKADLTLLAQKADKTELAQKADLTLLAQKADKTELAQKADLTLLAQKADKTELAQKVDKADSKMDGAVRERIHVLGNVNGSASIDVAEGSFVTATATGATSWTFTGTAANYATLFTLALTNGGAGVQTFPATSMGTAPTLQTNGVDILVFVHDGTAWRYAKAGA